jgi:hypothetical protein
MVKFAQEAELLCKGEFAALPKKYAMKAYE